MANVAGALLEIIEEERAAGPLARRRRLFRETPQRTAVRWVLGTAYACHPKRIADVPRLLRLMGTDIAQGGTRVPRVAGIASQPDGFAGVCRDISAERILAAACKGFYPWSHIGPLKWWNPSQRMVLFLPEHHIAKRLRPIMRKTPWRVTFDTAFEQVIKACSEPRSNRSHALTWITPQIMRLYTQLHDQGHAHSVEVWDEHGHLVGGSYGLAVGRVFITESLFFRVPNASKIGLHVLNHHLAKWGFAVNDNKAWSDAMAAMGYRLIPRDEYLRVLGEATTSETRRGKWRVEDSPAVVAG